jgi:hypothetical protein
MVPGMNVSIFTPYSGPVDCPCSYVNYLSCHSGYNNRLGTGTQPNYYQELGSHWALGLECM